jgi:integrase
LLPALAQDLREYRLAAGRPPEDALILGSSWTKEQWQMWRVDRWAPACRVVGLDSIPRPYELRHSFASSRQLGHSLVTLLSTYSHLLTEYKGHEIDADREIERARSRLVPVSRTASTIRADWPFQKVPVYRAFAQYRYRDSNPSEEE